MICGIIAHSFDDEFDSYLFGIYIGIAGDYHKATNFNVGSNIVGCCVIVG